MGDTPAYVVNDEPLVAALQRLDVQQLIDVAAHAWYNQTLCRVGDLVVRLRQAFIVPKRFPHRPVVAQRSAVLMIERGDVVATGD